MAIQSFRCHDNFFHLCLDKGDIIFIETFTREVIEYFGFKITDSEYLYVTVNRLVKNLAKRFGDKYNVRKW